MNLILRKRKSEGKKKGEASLPDNSVGMINTESSREQGKNNFNALGFKNLANPNHFNKKGTGPGFRPAALNQVNGPTSTAGLNNNSKDSRQLLVVCPRKSAVQPTLAGPSNQATGPTGSLTQDTDLAAVFCSRGEQVGKHRPPVAAGTCNFSPSFVLIRTSYKRRDQQLYNQV